MVAALSAGCCVYGVLQFAVSRPFGILFQYFGIEGNGPFAEDVGREVL